MPGSANTAAKLGAVSLAGAPMSIALWQHWFSFAAQLGKLAGAPFACILSPTFYCYACLTAAMLASLLQVAAHVDIAAKLGKPLIIDEFNIRRPNLQRNEGLELIYSLIHNSSATVAG